MKRSGTRSNRKSSVRAKSATRTAVSRRRFLGAVAAGVGASSLLQSRIGLVSPVLQAQIQPIRPTAQNSGIPTGKQVLTASDFQYAGLFTLPGPTAGVRFGYSSGAMTARRVGGTLQFLVTGVNAEAGGLPGDLVHEVSYPGYGASIATAPRAALIRTWGDVYQGKRLVNSAQRLPDAWPALGEQPAVLGVRRHTTTSPRTTTPRLARRSSMRTGASRHTDPGARRSTLKRPGVHADRSAVVHAVHQRQHLRCGRPYHVE